MKLRNITVLILILGLSIRICFGQEAEQSENWLQEYGFYQYPTLVFRYDRYSKADLVKFREKLDLMKNAKFADEWEGSYFSDLDQLGVSSFRWDSNVGFIELYIYTCFPELRHINYGKVVNAPDYVEMFPEFAADSPRKSLPVRYVKVRWNDRRYLVEESSLAAFAEKVVGIYVEPQDDETAELQKWSNYWVSGDTEIETEVNGLPQYPSSYKQFERFPIKTKLTSVGKRTIESEKEIENNYYTNEVAIYPVTIGAGKSKGVKVGMSFYLSETGDKILITQVNQNSSNGIIIREFDEDKNEYCLDKDFSPVACRKIKTSMKAETQVGFPWY
jgi:hypothetical protein